MITTQDYPLPLHTLSIERPELVDEDDGRPEPQTMAFFGSLRDSCSSLATLRIRRIPDLRHLEPTMPSLGFSLPSVKTLRLEANKQPMAALEGEIADVQFLDEVSTLQSDVLMGTDACLPQNSHHFIAEFLKCFPGLTHLRLERWLLLVEAEKLAALDMSELKDYSPEFSNLLEVLGATSIEVVRLDWSPHPSQFETLETLHLTRGVSGQLVRTSATLNYDVWDGKTWAPSSLGVSFADASYLADI